jgi:hypothetical protein
MLKFMAAYGVRTVEPRKKSSFGCLDGDAPHRHLHPSELVQMVREEATEEPVAVA